MRKQEIQEAFSQLHASENLVKEVIAMKSEKKNNGRVRPMMIRAAVCAALVAAIVLTALLWDGGQPGEQMGMPTVGTTAATGLPTTLPDVPTAPTQGYELVKMSGVLKVYACEAKDMDNIQREEYLLIEGTEPSYKTAWSPIVNLLTRGVTLTLRVEEKSLSMHELSYEVSVNCGELYGDVFHEKYREEGDPIGKENWDNAYWGKQGIGENGETIHWTGDELFFGRESETTLEEAIEKAGRIHLDIIVKADGNIVGYVVLEMICTNTKVCIFNAVLVDSGYFPKVDGEFQNVTEEYVRELIEEKMASQAM